MAFIVAPDFRIRSANWSLSRPSQINTSGWTGRRTVTAEPWHGKWRAEIELAPLTGADARSMRSFLARCLGTINTFRLYATAEKQNDNVDVVVASLAAAGARSMMISGAATALLDGEFVTVNGQFLQLTGFQSGSEITFEPPLRQQATAGTRVVTSMPYALVHLAEAVTGWSVEPGLIYGMSFTVEEAILEADGTVPESQLVTNGTFGTDTAGWTPTTNAVLSAVGGRLRVATSTTSSQYGSQSISLTPFMTYRLTADLFGGTGPALLRIGSDVGGAGGGGFKTVGINSSGSADITFVAPSSPMYISAWVDSNVANSYAEFDNISLRVA